MSGEKRSQTCEDTLHAETVIIVDIEGTTTSISFVKETLFPYVRENLKQYIEKNWDVDELKADLEKLKEQAKKDETDKVDGVVSITGATPEEERESLVKNVLWQMDGDRKTGALKQLQGHMWREAYKSGVVKGHVYEDVPKAFDEWTKSGRKVYVYSSGSVEAQKLLFGHSEHGDMSKYLSDYFDTEVGAKQESSSYKNILAKLDAQPSSVLFLTDIAKEAQAAKEAGLSAKIVVRPGNASLTDEEKVTFATIESFMDLSFQTSAKRQKLENSSEKKIAESVTSIPEPMDTSEEEQMTSDEKNTEKSAEKIDETKKNTVDIAKVEEAKISEKSELTGMEVDGKVETEKKTTEVVDKPPVVLEETKKKEEESKTNEKIELTKEAVAVSEVAKRDSEVAKNDSKIAKIESEIAKKEVEIAKTDCEIAKKDCEIAKKEIEIAKKDSEIAKKDIEIAKKETEVTKTEEIAAPAANTTTTTTTTTTTNPAKQPENEPMDEDKKKLSSKSETANAAITENKTEVSEKPEESSVKTEQPKTVTESCKPSETLTESKAKNETDEKANSATSDSSTSVTVAEIKIEKKTSVEDKPSTMMIVEKIEPEVAPKTMVKVGTKELDGKSTANDEKKIKEDVKQNGDSASAKKDEAQSSDKEKSNGDTKEEKPKIDQVATVQAPVVAAGGVGASATTATAVETTKVQPIVEKCEEKIEPIVESAKKEETETEIKAKIDEIPAVEINDAKLNGTSVDNDNDKNVKPHRNGLNGDTSTEESNGDTKKEAKAATATAAASSSSSQNGEAESSTGAASSAESIKTKKVVDSTIADGAGEPDVVPPVAVTATS